MFARIYVSLEDTFKGKFDNDLNLTSSSKKVSVSQNELKDAFLSLPQKIPFPKNLVLNLHKKEGSNEFYLSYFIQNENGKPVVNESPANSNLLTPFPQSPFDFHKEEAISSEQGTQFRMKVQWDGEYMDPPLEFPTNDVFKSLIS